MYPYLVTDEYPDVLSTAAQQQRRIGHGLSHTLVTCTHPRQSGELLASVSAAELDSAGTDLDTAYAQAGENLSAALSAGEIPMRMFDLGPAGVPAVVISGSWLAAATLVAPGLWERMTRLLGSEVAAAVPHRELLLLFPSDGVAGMQGVVEAAYRSAVKPLTTGLFRLGEDGPAPLP
jgi:hypothetical protein